MTRFSWGPFHTHESESVGRFTALFVETQLEDQLVVYCQSGHHSNIAVKTLTDLGFRHVYNVTGSMNAWLAAGFPVESGRCWFDAFFDEPIWSTESWLVGGRGAG